jgi:hypothetical protein
MVTPLPKVFGCFFFFLEYEYFYWIDQPKRSDFNIDEHFRKSLGGNCHTFPGRCLTPDDSPSNSSPIEQTPG